MEVLFPVIDQALVFERVVDVVWRQHGGSGAGVTWTEAWEMEWDDLTALIEEINRRRSAEAEAMRRARRGSR